MNDLDTALRAMLQERAGDITTLPADLTDLTGPTERTEPADRAVLELAPVRTLRSPQRTSWLIAAAVAAVLAVGGTTLAVGLNSQDRQRTVAPATGSRHTPTPTATTTIERTVATSWFGLTHVPGFSVRLRIADPGVRQFGLLRAGDTGFPAGSNGGAHLSAQVLVYDKGRYPASATGILSGGRVDVGGISGYRTSTPTLPSSGGVSVPTLAWQYAPGSWAVVQYLTDTSTAADGYLSTIAAAVRPTQELPITVPFRLGFLPDLPLTEIVDDRAEGYSMMLTFRRGARMVSVTLNPKRTYSGTGVTTSDEAVTIGGLPGHVSADAVYGVLYHDGSLLLGVSEDSGTLTTTDRAAGSRIAAGLTWANGDGCAPGVSLERAIP